ncbi:MAG TPA: hypothetical protein VN641_09845 [Urbifossiella sp.]|nr:hypothetical protein [Urbifossiella sp.]
MAAGAEEEVTRGLTPAEQAAIEEVLRKLREHFHEWQGYEGDEWKLVGFAYYEGCGDSDDCGQILVEASPIALGKELVAKHGFRWAMLRSGQSWKYAVVHPDLGRPIDLQALEDGSWNEEEYDEPPESGKLTHDSLDTIVRRVEQAKRRDRDR